MKVFNYEPYHEFILNEYNSQQEKNYTKIAKKLIKEYDLDLNPENARKAIRRVVRSTFEECEESSSDTKEESKAKPFIMSAWKQSGGVMNIDEYCQHHGLPRDDVRSYKLVSHTGIPFYNVQFRETALEESIDVDFISDVVSKYILPVKLNRLEIVKTEWIDRLIITDIHINMNNHGSSNKLPLYDAPLYDEKEIFRRLGIAVNHVINFQRGSDLYIDNLGDFMDGEKGQTTRGGHALPQIYSDKKAFEIAVDFKIKLVESLLPYYNTITLNNIIDDNHSFLMSYYVHSAVKRVLEMKYPDVVIYNILESFISQYSISEHRFVLSHGKDSAEMKFGWKPKLDDKLVKNIDGYLKAHKLYDGKTIEISKGDSHQYISDYTTSLDFDYHTYPSFSPPSNWVQHNFGNSISGVVLQNINVGTNKKLVIPEFF